MELHRIVCQCLGENLTRHGGANIVTIYTNNSGRCDTNIYCGFSLFIIGGGVENLRGSCLISVPKVPLWVRVNRFNIGLIFFHSELKMVQGAGEKLYITASLSHTSQKPSTS